MKEVELSILAEDIRTTSFIDSGSCAITRALERAGLNMRETGGIVRANDSIWYQETPRELLEKVMAMYAYALKDDPIILSKYKCDGVQLVPTEPADFTFKLIFTI